MGDAYFHQPATRKELHSWLADDVRGVISTTVHKFADAGKDLPTRDNIIVMVDEAHRTQSAKLKSLAGPIACSVAPRDVLRHDRHSGQESRRGHLRPLR